MAPAVSATPRKRARRNFSHLEQTPQLARVIPVPNLIEIQRKSFLDFLATGIRETIDDISPIEDYTGTLAVEFGEYVFDARRVLHPRVPREGPDVRGSRSS